MFNLDLILFNLIYRKCLLLGLTFGYGALEGAVIYAAIIMAGVTSLSNAKKVKK